MMTVFSFLGELSLYRHLVPCLNKAGFKVSDSFQHRTVLSQFSIKLVNR